MKIIHDGVCLFPILAAHLPYLGNLVICKKLTVEPSGIIFTHTSLDCREIPITIALSIRD